MGCGAAEATGPGFFFCCYQPLLASQQSFWGLFFFIYIDFPILPLCVCVCVLFNVPPPLRYCVVCFVWSFRLLGVPDASFCRHYLCTPPLQNVPLFHSPQPQRTSTAPLYKWPVTSLYLALKNRNVRGGGRKKNRKEEVEIRNQWMDSGESCPNYSYEKYCI